MFSNSVHKREIEWHDIQICPDDLPGTEEPIILTLEDSLGDRMVWIDAYLKDADDDRTIFCTKVMNEFNKLEEIPIWYEPIAWAYPPLPYKSI